MMDSYYEPNNAYGGESIYRTYAKWDNPVAAIMARGLEIEPERVFPGEINIPVRAVMPWSDMRAKAWESINTSKRIIRSAAPFLYLDKMQELERKKEYTLFTPMHQTHGVNLSTDWWQMACSLKKLPQPVVVTMHPSDWETGAHRVFEKKGYDVICIGDYYYPLGLENMRKLISWAKMACSNNVSTHTLYCTMMGVPYFMWGDRPHVVPQTTVNLRQWYTTTPEGFEVETSIYDLYGKEPTDTITPEQTAAARFHLGADHMKSPEELRRDLDWCERLLKDRDAER